MKIAIIGYKNHALRLKKCLINQGYENIINFNYRKHNFKSISDSDAFFIASPNSSHMEWIDKIGGINKYIFCEKPPVTNEKDLQRLKDYRNKLFFNFNYRFSYLVKTIQDYKKTKELGKVIYVNCISTHGLAYKPAFKNNWRFNSDNFFSSIVGNLGIHYIDLMLYLFGKTKKIDLNYLSIASKNLPDSCKISLYFSNSLVNIFLSYATVFKNKIDIFYENGLLSLSNGTISVMAPRETFDDNGFFITPKKQIIKKYINSRDYYDNSLDESIKYFLNCVKKKSNISKNYYKQSILSNKILLDMGKNINL